MPSSTATFRAPDGTRLAYHQAGTGEPLVCLPGGPMWPTSYLGDLGGLPAYRSLVMLDLRGTGESAVPTDPASYRCDRLTGDAEALRSHLGHDRIDLLGHSAGATLAVLYAARYPHRVGRLVLVAPSPRAAGLRLADADLRGAARLRQGEPWFPVAFAAIQRVWSGQYTGADRDASAPFFYGRWNEASQAHHARAEAERNVAAAAMYYADGALDPGATRSALTRLQAPVLVVAGEYDVALPPKYARDYAGMFVNAEVAVQPGAGHYPWLDDPGWFTAAVARFLR